MIVAGCDIGSLTSKAVILNNRNILSQAVMRSSFRPDESARKVMDKALADAGIGMDELSCCVGTGYGREKIPFVDRVFSEIACHAKGARHLMPAVRTVIDIGGQDCKAIRLDDRGSVVKFITNDKCAAGTGRFLDVMARLLGVDPDRLGRLSARAGRPLSLASTCTVWAQAEVIHHLNENTPIADIAAAVNQAMAGRVAILARSVGLQPEVCMTGGVAKNVGVVAHLEKLLDVKIRRLRIDPQIIGAFGAALYAGETSGGASDDRSRL